jgi:alkylation response protein AidB-like acyl-CoA dehydrogenase
MSFRASARDLAFALRAAGFDAVRARHPDLDADTAEAVLDGAARFATEVLAPLNRVGDTQGARFRDGQVRAPEGFTQAYRAFAAGGWTALSADPEHGGQGLPKALEIAVSEMFQAGNMAFALCPMLTLGAAEALARHGSERQRRLVLPRLVDGSWTGTMQLTEPQAGSDLANLRTRAEPAPDGSYRLTGEKIFITWGDHDLAENIVHLVLARTPDAPPGVRGVSLFLTTKYAVRDGGGLGEANAVGPASIEHKLGIHGSPTCVMQLEGARAELVGELNHGLAHMFVMMNAARLHVGIQGAAIGERAFQQALAFAQERRQGRSVWSGDYPARIYDHPDVRRTLMLMKAKVEAARGLCLMTAVQSDLARLGDCAASRAAALSRQELLTPIAKSWSTDVGVEVASMGLQVHGGMGFIEETGAAQHYRDARIAPIYEGTNGIQALDLIGRKLGHAGEAMNELCADMLASAARMAAQRDLAPIAARVADGARALLDATRVMVWREWPEAQVLATPYLKLAGDVIGGWALARQAELAAGAEAPWLKTRIALAAFYAGQVLPQAVAAADVIAAAVPDLEAVRADTLSP